VLGQFQAWLPSARCRGMAHVVLPGWIRQRRARGPRSHGDHSGRHAQQAPHSASHRSAVNRFH
jgi:hypothetical protein